ncbi:MAG: helix-turn-helix transcriptional regulator [Oscillospiraceae bacterium]|jgi:transcriptional regulator with XRE-family HTH domain|nr:helix-turn-helix transcriptional regulator [Oscillospiraceae bacterium]
MDVSRATITRLRALCLSKGITVNGLSYRAGVTQSTVNDIFTGKTHNPGIATLKKLCDGLDISMRNFFNSPLFEDLEQEIK